MADLPCKDAREIIPRRACQPKGSPERTVRVVALYALRKWTAKRLAIKGYFQARFAPGRWESASRRRYINEITATGRDSLKD